jgi:hypothetical protein
MYVNLGNLKADTFVLAKGFSHLFFFPPSLFFFSLSCKVYGSLRGLDWYLAGLSSVFCSKNITAGVASLESVRAFIIIKRTVI